MKEIIEQLYFINVDEIEQVENYTLIKSNGIKYKLREINDIGKIYFYQKVLNDNYMKIVLTKNNDKYFELNKRKYVLLTFANKNQDKKIISPIIVPTIGDKRSIIWERKIDGYMKYLGMNSIQNEKIEVYLNYYIGLLENIISIYNKCYKNADKIRYSISHNKISCPIIEEQFYDPFELLVDSIDRDFAEYIKENVDSLDDKINHSISIIRKYNFNIYELNLFLIRIIYPKNFFEAVDDYIGMKKEINLNRVLHNQKENEKLYKELLKKIKPTNFIYKISWLL